MIRYKYQALDAQGQEVSGILTAQAEREAIRQLQRRGLTTLVLTPLEKKAAVSAQKLGRPAKRQDVIIVLHELATLLESGISLIEAVEALAHSSHPVMLTQTFAQIALQLRQGSSLSVAFRTSTLQLPWYVTQLVEAGELTGKLAIALRDGVEQMEYETKVANELRNAMIYPIILIISGIAAVLMIFTLVVPRFAGMLQNRQVELPWLAQAVLQTGMFLNTHFIWIIGLIGFTALFSVYLFQHAQLRAKLADLLIQIPFLGGWMIEAETAKWAAMMGTLLDNRVSLLHALELAAQGTHLPSLQKRLIQVSKAVRAGTHLSQALQDNEALTATGHNLIRAGERAGDLPRMLNSLAKLLEESGRMRMKRFLLLIEPLAILIIGSIIGIIITGVILAITSVNKITL